jgi:hypothetical protein
MCAANPRYVSDLAKIKKEDPVLYGRVRTGELNVRRAVEAFKAARAGQDLAGSAAGDDGRPGGAGSDDDAQGGGDAALHAPRAGGQANTPDLGQTTNPPKGATGGARRGKNGPAARRKHSPGEAHPGGEGHGQVAALLRFLHPEGPPPSSEGCTVERVDRALTMVVEVLVGLMRFLTDDAVSPLIRQIERQPREGHHEALRAVIKQLPGLMDSLFGDEP